MTLTEKEAPAAELPPEPDSGLPPEGNPTRVLQLLIGLVVITALFMCVLLLAIGRLFFGVNLPTHTIPAVAAAAVLGDLHPQVGVRQAHAVAGRGSEHFRVSAASDAKRHIDDPVDEFKAVP